jgi:hypothetical protein
MAAMALAGPTLRSLALAWNEDLLMSTEWRTWRQLATAARPELLVAFEILVTAADGPLSVANTDGLREFIRRLVGVGADLHFLIMRGRKLRAAARCVTGRDACDDFPWCRNAHVDADAPPLGSEVLWDEARRDGLGHGIIAYPFYERGVCPLSCHALHSSVAVPTNFVSACDAARS